MVHFALMIGYIMAATIITRFTSPYGNDVRSTLASLYGVYARSAIDCSIRCRSESKCRGANYVPGTGYCEMIKVLTTAGDIEASIGTRYILRPGMYAETN